ncbi:MAG: hypothetical protein Kow00103_03350 [Candidatus Caldatribacteriota bacterium]
MERDFQYSIFLTSWGWTGVIFNQEGLRFFVLPLEKKEDIIFELKKIAEENKLNIFEYNNSNKENKAKILDLISKVQEYYKGKKVNFFDYQLNLKSYTPFQKKVLSTVNKVPYGILKSYQEIAIAAGFPRAFRAVGNMMRENPLPLIVPCHRVIRSDGKLGGFSGRKGIALKKKMIDWEITPR